MSPSSPPPPIPSDSPNSSSPPHYQSFSDLGLPIFPSSNSNNSNNQHHHYQPLLGHPHPHLNHHPRSGSGYSSIGVGGGSSDVVLGVGENNVTVASSASDDEFRDRQGEDGGGRVFSGGRLGEIFSKALNVFNGKTNKGQSKGKARGKHDGERSGQGGDEDEDDDEITTRETERLIEEGIGFGKANGANGGGGPGGYGTNNNKDHDAGGSGFGYKPSSEPTALGNDGVDEEGGGGAALDQLGNGGKGTTRGGILTWFGGRQRRRRQPGEDGNGNGNGDCDRVGNGNENGEATEDRELNTFRMMLLTIGLAGAQLTWTLEMAYGTPYLLNLGLSKSLTSLVWLAGPLSGLIAQPLIGSFSDASTSRFRRRKYIIGGGVVVVISSLVVAFAQEIGGFLIDLWAALAGGGVEGDWDPKRGQRVQDTAVGLAVFFFYLLDFGLNTLQASLRALILDVAPARQQSLANAWHGRMTHAGHIAGFFAGYVDLGKWSGLGWLGGGQFRKLACLSVVILVICLAIECTTQKEPERVDTGDKQGLGHVLVKVWKAIKELPMPVRRVCYVQFFAFLGWFPFLFYATTYVAEIVLSEHPGLSPDEATEIGSLGLLMEALVALITGTFLPVLCSLSERESVLTAVAFRHTDTPIQRRLRTLGRFFLRLFTLRNFWGFSCLLFGILMGFCTFFVTSNSGAVVVIAFVGISWAATCWVPFALVMENVREVEDSYLDGLNTSNVEENPVSKAEASRRNSIMAFMSRNNKRGYDHAPFRGFNAAEEETAVRERITGALTECRPLLGDGKNRRSIESAERRESLVKERESQGKEAGGTILGIHNLAIVAPQFVVAIISAIIFKIVATASDSAPRTPIPGDEDAKAGSDVVYVLRFGGVMALVAAVLVAWVPAPTSEREALYLVKRASGLVDDEED